MVTGELRRRVDALWTEFWQGGITNPLTVIEQITFLMYARLLDVSETREENRQKRTRTAFQRRFKSGGAEFALVAVPSSRRRRHAPSSARQGIPTLQDGGGEQFGLCRVHEGRTTYSPEGLAFWSKQ